MKILVGLGNPGDRYKNTRHNVGFMLVDRYVQANGGVWENDTKSNAHIARVGDTLVIKPQTFMNKSGECVAKVLSYYKVPVSDICVVHDDVDLDLGRLKIQIGASSAGHRGVESIIGALGTKEFARMRVGIGRPENKNIDIEDWVLQNFSKEELELILSLNLGFE